MRRESSTVVALVGEVDEGLLARLGQVPNVSVVRVPKAADDDSWEPGAAAMREAAHRGGTYVVVGQDPLAGVASAWQAMWAPGGGGTDSGMEFEQRAAQTLAAWQGKQFELPDYYLVIAPAPDGPDSPDLYLGPLRSARPRRVAVTTTSDSSQQTARLVEVLRYLPYGPWWPPLGDLLDTARRFFPGGLTE